MKSILTSLLFLFVVFSAVAQKEEKKEEEKEQTQDNIGDSLIEMVYYFDTKLVSEHYYFKKQKTTENTIGYNETMVSWPGYMMDSETKFCFIFNDVYNSVRVTNANMPYVDRLVEPSRSTLTITDSTKEILGYSCKKCVALQSDGQKVEFWVTSEISTSIPTHQLMVSRLGGVASTAFCFDNLGFILEGTYYNAKNRPVESYRVKEIDSTPFTVELNDYKITTYWYSD